MQNSKRMKMQDPKDDVKEQFKIIPDMPYMPYMPYKEQLLVIISNLKNEIYSGVYNPHRYKSYNGSDYTCVCCGFKDTTYATGCLEINS